MILGRNGFVSVGDISNASVDPSMQRPANFPPTKPVFPFPVAPPLRKVDQQQQSKGTSPGANPSGTGGIPFILLSLSAVQSPVKEQAQVASLITVSWTQQADPNFDHVNIWIVGYHGSSNPQLAAAGSTAPVNFTLDATGETISVYAQTASSVGAAAPILFAAHTTVTLSGAVTNPPAPIIVQALTGIPIGYQFSFEQIALPPNDEEVISAYRVYKNSANNFATATLNKTLVQDPTATGAIVVQDNVGGGKTFYYWVTSVNSAGLESLPTAAQPSTVVSGSVDPSTSDVLMKGSVPPAVTAGFVFTSTTTSITFTWPALSILQADGSSLMIAAGSQVVTGLAVGTTYYFYPVYNVATGLLHWTTDSDNANTPNLVGANEDNVVNIIKTANSLTRPTTYSLELWVAFTDTVSAVLAEFVQNQTGSPGTLGAAVSASAGTFSGSTGSASLIASRLYNDSAFHHVVFTYNGTTGFLYVDGLQVATGSLAGPSSFSGFWRIGDGSVTSPETRIISSVAVYPSILTAFQVSNHYMTMTQTGPTAYNALVATDGATSLWKISETSGTSIADAIGTNTGTLVNTTGAWVLNQSLSAGNFSVGSPAIAFTNPSDFALQYQILQGHIPLSAGGITAATTSSGTGGGSIGGTQGKFNQATS